MKDFKTVLAKDALVILALALALVTTLSSCGTEITYPNLEYNHSEVVYDIRNRTILLREGYMLSDGNPYNIVETDAGYDMVLHFVPSEDEG